MPATGQHGLPLILGLFRRILRVHRDRLPPPLRPLGDKYVRSEFLAHLRSPDTTSQQWRQFLLQWQGYALALEGKSPPGGAAAAAPGPEEGVPAESLEQALNDLSPEQRQTLEKVRQATEQLGEELTTRDLAMLLSAAQGRQQQPGG